MNLEYFIARRTAQGAATHEPSIMMRVSTFAVGLGIVVMIITLAVIGGFKVQINDKLSGLSGHVVLSTSRGVQSPMPITYSSALDSLICATSPAHYSQYILRGAIARGGGVMSGVVVKGVDSLYNTKFFGRHLVAGSLPHFGQGQSRRELLISKELADDMELELGDRVSIIFTDEGDIEPLTFKVAAIFSAGIGEMERGVVVADIATLRRVNGWASDQISGVELWFDNMERSTDIATWLNDEIFFSASPSLDNIAATPIEWLYPSLFDWLKTHDINGAIVIIIMVIVALFNMVTALLILVLERTRMVGVLKSLGMGNGALQRIFLYRALGVIGRGVAWGNLVGVSLCWAQSRWGVVKLDSSGYMLSEVPIDMNWWWIVALNVGVVGVILLVMTIPTRIVATITPDEIVKYK